MIWHPQWIKWSYRQDSVAAARGDSAKPKYQSANTIRLPGCSNCKTTMSTSQLTKGTSRSIAPLCFELLFASFWASRGNQLPTQGKRWEVGKKKKKNTSLYPSSSASTGIVQQSAERFALRGWTSGGIITMQLPCDPFCSQGYLG